LIGVNPVDGATGPDVPTGRKPEVITGPVPAGIHPEVCTPGWPDEGQPAVLMGPDVVPAGIHSDVCTGPAGIHPVDPTFFHPSATGSSGAGVPAFIQLDVELPPVQAPV